MSRIHDALKKAEQERSRRTLTPLESDTADFLGVDTTTRDEMLPGSVVDDAVPMHPEFRDGSGLLTVDDLKTRVRRVKWTPNPQTMLFFGKESYAPGTEEFRTLRSHLYTFRDMHPLRTVLITSASPQEGKSFIASNLAQIIVQQPNRRVLLIDADLRWSRIHLSFGAPSSPGLTEYLEGEADELSIMQQGPLENLFFIPGGKHALQPAELISNGRLKTLLQRLAPLFDWIIIDTPPAMAVSDPRVMSDLCDGVLLVVSAAKEPYDVLQKTRQQFIDKRLLGVVLNRAEPRMSYSYKYYGYYKGDAGKNGKRKG
jgi:protein-tyrosine kinase